MPTLDKIVGSKISASLCVHRNSRNKLISITTQCLGGTPKSTNSYFVLQGLAGTSFLVSRLPERPIVSTSIYDTYPTATTNSTTHRYLSVPTSLHQTETHSPSMERKPSIAGWLEALRCPVLHQLLVFGGEGSGSNCLQEYNKCKIIKFKEKRLLH